MLAEMVPHVTLFCEHLLLVGSNIGLSQFLAGLCDSGNQATVSDA